MAGQTLLSAQPFNPARVIGRARAIAAASTAIFARRAGEISAAVSANPGVQAIRKTLGRNPVIERWWRSIDHGLLGLSLALLTIGVMLSFASTGAAADRLGYDTYHFLIRQSVFATAAAGMIITLSMLSPTNARRLATLLVLGSIGLLIVVLAGGGHEAKGAARWIKLGPLSLQPSEILKPAVVVTVAWFFSKRIEDENFPAPQATLVLLGMSVGLMLMQPDVGQSILLTTTVLTVFFIAGVSWVWIAGLGASGAVGLVALYFLVPHFRERIAKFTSANEQDNEQLQRALDSIASGGILGVGPGEGVHKSNLPDAHTDFIYSLAAEEFGMIASIGLIVLFAVLVVGGLIRAAKLRDPFCYLAATGLFILVGYQAGINLSVNLDMTPTKGMTLPFISYGGSSLIGTALSIGLALALTRRKPGDRLKDF
jgi:cell division protein FtsW